VEGRHHPGLPGFRLLNGTFSQRSAQFWHLQSR
jgi:hypothetical protein